MLRKWRTPGAGDYGNALRERVVFAVAQRMGTAPPPIPPRPSSQEEEEDAPFSNPALGSDLFGSFTSNHLSSLPPSPPETPASALDAAMQQTVADAFSVFLASASTGAFVQDLLQVTEV